MTKPASTQATSEIADHPLMGTSLWRIGIGRADFSPNALKMFGLETGPDLNGFFDLLHPADRLRVEAECTAFFEAGGTFATQYRILRSDGKQREILSHTLTEQAGDGGTVLRSILLDISGARGSIGPRIPPSSEIYGFYDLDVETSTSTWTPGLQMILDHRGHDETSVGLSARLVHPDDRAMFDRQQTQALRQAGRYAFTFRIVRADGSIRYVEDRGESYGAVNPRTGMVARATGSLTDVTQTRLGAKAEGFANPAFWNIVDTAPFGVYAVDADFRIVRVSKGGEAAFAGISPVLGRDLAEVLRIIWPEAFAAEAIARVRHTLLTGESYRASPVVDSRADRGTVESYDWGLEQMILADGRPGVVCHFYDLTERMSTEAELRRQKRRLSMAYRAASMGAWEFDVRKGKTYWTDEVYAMFGYDRGSDAPDTIWLKTVHPDDLVRIDAAFDNTIRTGATLDEDYDVTRPDGTIRHIASRGEMLTGKDGVADRIVGINFDVTERKRAEMALRRSEERLKLVIDRTIAFVGVLDPDGTVQEANAPALAVADLARADVVGKPFWETYWWSYDNTVAARLKEAVSRARDGEVVRYDAVVRTGQDALMTIEFMLAPVCDEDGTTTMLIASGFDVSGREAARRRVQDLMGEINHRSKNLLTVVDVMARHSARSGEPGFIERFQQRVRALAAAQDIVLQTARELVDLKALVHTQLAHFGDLVGGRIFIEGPPILVAPHAAQALGMALHELSTNAGKYGALSGDAGRVEIGWERKDGTVQITWRESGGPPVQAPQKSGFGTAVIDQMASASLDAKVDLVYAPGGLRWHLTCAEEALRRRH